MANIDAAVSRAMPRLGPPLFVACLFAALPCSAQDVLPLWRDKGTACQASARMLETKGCLAVDIDAKRLTPDTKQLSVVLPGNKEMLVTLRQATPALRGFVWNGQGEEIARATFSVVGDAIVGDVELRDSRRVFRLRYTPAREYVVEEIDPAKIK